MFEDLDPNNLKARDLIVFIGTPIILIGGAIAISSISTILLNSTAFLLVGIFFFICGLVILKRKKTGDGDHIDTYNPSSDGAISIIYFLLLILSPLMKNKSGKSAKVIGYLIILLGLVLIIGSLWYGLPQLERVLNRE